MFINFFKKNLNKSCDTVILSSNEDQRIKNMQKKLVNLSENIVTSGRNGRHSQRGVKTETQPFSKS